MTPSFYLFPSEPPTSMFSLHFCFLIYFLAFYITPLLSSLFLFFFLSHPRVHTQLLSRLDHLFFIEIIPPVMFYKLWCSNEVVWWVIWWLLPHMKHLLFMVGEDFLDPEVLLGSCPLCLAVSVEGLLTPTLGVILMESNYSRQRTLANLIKLVNLAMLKGRVILPFVGPKANTRKCT